MSFILDALRKSETERQQQTGPVLAASGQRAPRQKRSVWPPVIVLVLIANAVGMAIIFYRGDSRPPDVTIARPDELPDISPAASTANLPVGEPDAAATAGPAVLQRQPVPEPAPTAASPRPADAEPAAGSSIQDALPTLDQLLMSGVVALAPLHMDIHVYSEDPENRFVFINMKKYREGEAVAEGPSIEEITTGGVVLNHQGNRFVLNRD